MNGSVLYPAYMNNVQTDTVGMVLQYRTKGHFRYKHIVASEFARLAKDNIVICSGERTGFLTR